MCRAVHGGEKTTVFRQPGNSNPVFRTVPEQKRTARNLTKKNKPAQGMQGDFPLEGSALMHGNTFSVLGEIAFLRCDIERIEILLHADSRKDST